MTTEPKITFRQPADLTVHPALRAVPQWSDDDPRFLALCDSVATYGVHEPIKVTDQGRIMDGRHRWRAAKRMQKPVPTIVLPEDMADELAVDTLLHRKHYTPGQRAYILAPRFKDAFEAARRRELAGVSVHPFGNPRNSVSSHTPEGWAKEIGITVQYLRQAWKIFSLFNQHQQKWTWSDESILQTLGHKPDTQLTLQEYYEPQILAEEDPIGLGAVVAGIGARLAQAEAEAAGKPHGGGPAKDLERQFELFTETFDDLSNRYQYWANFDDQAKAKARDHITTALAAAPPELRRHLTAAAMVAMTDDDLKALTKSLTAEKKRRKKTKTPKPDPTATSDPSDKPSPEADAAHKAHRLAVARAKVAAARRRRTI
jgi:hypothetical protein